MKKITKAGIALMLGVSLVFMLNSCEKLADDATETADSAEDMASDMVVLSSLTDAIQDIISSDPNLQMKNGNPFISGEYFSYAGDDSVFTDGDGIKIYFEFEDDNHPDYPYISIADDPVQGTGSTGGDGATRWGAGYITMDKPYSDPNCVVNLELDRYIVLKEGTLYQIDDGDNKIGSKYECVIRRTGPDSWDIEYNMSFKMRKLGENSASPKTYGAGTFHITTTDGGSDGLLDDEMTVTASSLSGKNKKSKSYSITISEPLKRVLTPGCSNTFVEGKMELKNDGSKFTIKADFGDGTCDNDIVVTLPGNVTKTITVN